MELLEERIRRDGVVKSEGVLKVDSFLNHQLDIDLFEAMGVEFKRLFADAPITKILTIEASGIGIACVVARHFGVPVVFAKKAQSINLDGDMYTTRIQSFTHGASTTSSCRRSSWGPTTTCSSSTTSWRTAAP